MQPRIKILLLTDWYYPGFKAGGPIQSCRNLVSALKDELDLFVFTSDRDLGEVAPYPNTPTDQWTEISPGEMVYYISPGKKFKSTLLEQINQINPDFIYLNSMFSFRYTIIPLWIHLRNKSFAKIVLAPRGMLHSGALQYKPFKKKTFIRMLNLLGIPKYIKFHATDDQEVKDIQSQFPLADKIFQAPNFASAIQPDRKSIAKNPGHLSSVFFSRISPKKNLLFALEILANHNFPGTIHLTVAGEIEDKTYWQSCLEKVKSFPSNIQFEYAGAIEHEGLLDWLQQFHFLFLPTFGENFGHAIFEAFIAGKPVIISDKTPWQDLQSKDLGWEIPLSDEQGFVNAITEALEMGQHQYNVMSLMCGSFADAYRNNNETRKRYLELFS